MRSQLPLLARTGPDAIADLSPLWEEERKSDFGATRSVDNPLRISPEAKSRCRLGSKVHEQAATGPSGDGFRLCTKPNGHRAGDMSAVTARPLHPTMVTAPTPAVMVATASTPAIMMTSATAMAPPMTSAMAMALNLDDCSIGTADGIRCRNGHC